MKYRPGTRYLTMSRITVSIIDNAAGLQNDRTYCYPLKLKQVRKCLCVLVLDNEFGPAGPGSISSLEIRIKIKLIIYIVSIVYILPVD